MAHRLFTWQLGRNPREPVEASCGLASELATMTSAALYELKQVTQLSLIQRKDSTSRWNEI